MSESASTPVPTVAAELRAARRSDPLGFVGERVTDPGPYAVVDRLQPGEHHAIWKHVTQPAGDFHRQPRLARST